MDTPNFVTSPFLLSLVLSPFSPLPLSSLPSCRIMATHSYLSFPLSCIFLIFLLQSFVTETSASRPATLPLSSLVVHGVQAARLAAAHVIRRPLDTTLHPKRTKLEFRDDGDDDGDDWPVFPVEPPSCPICESNYANIDHCAEACPIFANFSMVNRSLTFQFSNAFLITVVLKIMFNPGAFVDVIECACTDTFQSTYPQCVDWYDLSDVQFEQQF